MKLLDTVTAISLLMLSLALTAFIAVMIYFTLSTNGALFH